MLTITCENSISENNADAQVETLPSDAEISRRVLQIRSGWTIQERVSRRRDAENRFELLLQKLSGCEAA
ncbi:hypothetical protein Poly51_16720 [Rubripirellula tenax]|uniref:Uncharacterized protein n=1 Tax=Rubripirellula tenax TaxID=2528015 RepID=A0A5C6FDS0_9BACT|nr:hypothetical protein [Rubripirellula tenax]TWU58892.1 hypothetical protein Poly51_16720 [Rubripirellula tenax]